MQLIGRLTLEPSKARDIQSRMSAEDLFYAINENDDIPMTLETVSKLHF